MRTSDLSIPSERVISLFLISNLLVNFFFIFTKYFIEFRKYCQHTIEYPQIELLLHQALW